MRHCLSCKYYSTSGMQLDTCSQFLHYKTFVNSHTTPTTVSQQSLRIATTVSMCPMLHFSNVPTLQCSNTKSKYFQRSERTHVLRRPCYFYVDDHDDDSTDANVDYRHGWLWQWQQQWQIDRNDNNVDERRGCLWQWQWQLKINGNDNNVDERFGCLWQWQWQWQINGNDNNIDERRGCLWLVSLSPLARCSQRLGGCIPYSPMSSSTKRFISQTLNRFAVYLCWSRTSPWSWTSSIRWWRTRSCSWWWRCCWRWTSPSWPPGSWRTPSTGKLESSNHMWGSSL